MGTAVILISHRLEEVSEIADRLSVLRDGQHVATRPIDEVTRDDMIQMMVGRKLSALFPKQDARIGDVILRTRDLGRTGVFKNINLDLRKGEILGLAGLVGAKRTDVAEALFGVKPADAGTIEVAGRVVRVRNARQAMSLGIAYVPEDRQHHGAIGAMNVTQNISLPILAAFSRLGFLNFGAEARYAETWRERLSIALSSVRQLVRELSGGNQQKVVISKWLATKPQILLLDEPTRGIDVGTKAEVHRLMSSLAAEGLAIVLISSELPEVLGMSDRILVMREGRLTGEFTRAEATQEKIMRAATETVRDAELAHAG
jgi:rhamnose transport system ATP-binding protein